MKKYHRNGLWLRLFCAFLVFAAGCTNTGSMVSEKQPSISQSPGPSQNSAELNKEVKVEESSKKAEPLRLKTAKQDLAKWPGRLIADSKDTFSRPDNITALLLAGGASIVMHQDADEKIADYFAEHRNFHNLKDESLYVIGYPATHFAASIVWYLSSIQNHDDLNKERAWTLRTALTITWIATMSLKLIRDNETPNSQNYAWPSGHTSSSFTVASVLDEFYGPKVGIPAYAVASLVAYRMMDTGDHWGSDVVFGATLGWIVGHSVAGKHKKLEIVGFELVPYIPITEEPAMGIGLVKKF
jgi:hypothetical protein